MDERFESATEMIKKELMIAFANPENVLPIPTYLNIDSELAIRIINMLDSNEKLQDLTNTNPTARINKMENNKYPQRTPPRPPNDRRRINETTNGLIN